MNSKPEKKRVDNPFKNMRGQWFPVTMLRRFAYWIHWHVLEKLPNHGGKYRYWWTWKIVVWLKSMTYLIGNGASLGRALKTTKGWYFTET